MADGGGNGRAPGHALARPAARRPADSHRAGAGEGSEAVTDQDPTFGVQQSIFDDGEVLRERPVLDQHGTWLSELALFVFDVARDDRHRLRIEVDGHAIDVRSPPKHRPAEATATAHALALGALEALDALRKHNDPQVRDRVQKAYFALTGTHSQGAKQRFLLQRLDELVRQYPHEKAADLFLATTLDVSARTLEPAELESARELARGSVTAWLGGAENGAKWQPLNSYLAAFGLGSANGKALCQVMKGRDW
jgi:hypothetical protein